MAAQQDPDEDEPTWIHTTLVLSALRMPAEEAEEDDNEERKAGASSPAWTASGVRNDYEEMWSEAAAKDDIYQKPVEATQEGRRTFS